MTSVCLTRSGCLAAAVLLFLLVVPLVSSGQPPADLPIIYDFGVGARAMGMGQAHVAACEDVSAMFYNPAALAQIRRIEFSTGFSQLSDNLETSLFGHKSTSTLGSTKLSSVGIAYPFPTYRGSFVLGFAYNRTRNTDSDYFASGAASRAYLGPDIGVVDDYQTTKDVFERGGLSNWTVAAGAEVAENVSVGVGFSFLGGRSELQYMWERKWDIAPPDYRFLSIKASDETKISGWTGSFGTLLKVGRVGRVGLTVRLPEYLSLSGQQYTELYDSGPLASSIPLDTAYQEAFEGDKITLPLCFIAGASVAPVPGLILAFDAKYADWKQIEYDGPIRIDNNYAYKATTSLRFGAEFMFPFAPLRVRGGFFTEPLAYRLMPSLTSSNEIWIASIDSDGKFYTLGAGYLFEESFTLDAAWVHGGYERSIPDHSEKKTTDKIFVSAGYHF